MAIDFRLEIAASPREDSGFRVFSVLTGERKKISASNLKYRKEDRWVNSLKAVISSFIEYGEAVPGLNITILSEIPPDSGFGTPNAMKVGLALVLRRLLRAARRGRMQDKTLVSLVERANTRFLNTHPHRADIFCALYAKKSACIKTDYRSNSYELTPFPTGAYSVVLIDSKVPRILAREELGLRIRECIRAYEIVRTSKDAPQDFSSLDVASLNEIPGIPESVRRRASFILQEAARVDDASRLLKKKDYAGFSKAVFHSHEGLRDCFEISCPEVDWIVKRVQEFSVPEKPDLVCSRLTGRGFGGCAYAVMRSEMVPGFIAKFDDYERIFGFKPAFYTVKPSQAAVML